MDPRREYKIDRAKERCLRRLEALVGELPRAAIAAVTELIAEVERVHAIPDADLDDTQVGRKAR